jgi:hypothetical protein
VPESEPPQPTANSSVTAIATGAGVKRIIGNTRCRCRSSHH